MNYKELSDKDIVLQFEVTLDEDLKMSLNKIWGGVHWGVRSTFRNIWHEEIWEIVKKNEIKPIQGQIHIQYEYEFKTRYLDTSNCAVMNKAIEDGLVEAGVLKDDTPQYITSSTTCVPIVPQSERRKMKYDKLTVTIYEIGIAPIKINGEVIRERKALKKNTTRGTLSEKKWKSIIRSSIIE